MSPWACRNGLFDDFLSHDLLEAYGFEKLKRRPILELGVLTPSAVLSGNTCLFLPMIYVLDLSVSQAERITSTCICFLVVWAGRCRPVVVLLGF